MGGLTAPRSGMGHGPGALDLLCTAQKKLQRTEKMLSIPPVTKEKRRGPQGPQCLSSLPPSARFPKPEPETSAEPHPQCRVLHPSISVSVRPTADLSPTPAPPPLSQLRHWQNNSPAAQAKPLEWSLHTHIRSVSRACWLPQNPPAPPLCTPPLRAWKETGASPWVFPPPASALHTVPQRPCLRPILLLQLKTISQWLSISLEVKDLWSYSCLIPPTSSPPLSPARSTSVPGLLVLVPK